MAYKTEMRKTTISSAISDGFGELESLASECREIVDNASEGLSQTSRIQTLDETANQLENFSEPTFPDSADLGDPEITYPETVNKSKRRGCSRAVRCQNAVAMLEAARDGLQEWLDLNTEAPESVRDEVQSLIDELDDPISDAEGCEFPGMFG